MAALINVPSKAKRGEIIEIKTLMSHIMETGFRHSTRRASFRATSSPASPAATTARRFSAPTVSGDRGEPVHHILHHRDRERHIRVRMDRRPRLFARPHRPPITVE